MMESSELGGTKLGRIHSLAFGKRRLALRRIDLQGVKLVVDLFFSSKDARQSKKSVTL